MVVLMTSCKSPELKLKTAKVYKKISQHETLKNRTENKVYYIRGIKNIFSYGKDTLIVIPESDRVFYVTNNNLEVIDVIDFKNIEYMVNPPIMGVAMLNKEIYFIDITFKLKKYNIAAKKVTIMPFRNRGNNILAVYDEANTYTTETNPEYPTYVIKNERPIKDEQKILLGIKSKGVDIRGNPIYTDISEYGSTEYTKYEVVYVQVQNSKIYFTFRLSRKVLIYDLNGYFIESKILLVDDDYYKPPEMQHANGRKTLVFSEINAQPLCYSDGYLTQLYRTKSGNEPSIVCYNDKIEPVCRYIIQNNNKSGEAYIRLYWICNKRLYTTNGMNGITIYE